MFKKIVSLTPLLLLYSCANFSSPDVVTDEKIKTQLSIEQNVQPNDIQITDRRSDKNIVYFTANIKGEKKQCQALTYATYIGTSRSVATIDCEHPHFVVKSCNLLLEQTGGC